MLLKFFNLQLIRGIMMTKVLMKGNEAMAEGAVRAGCKFFSGYPITPQTEVLEYLVNRLPEVGGDCIQTESELAGINMLFGAVAAGARGLSSSSSPGFAHYQEGISFLAANDLPAVLINVSRMGNGLGDLPTGQGDYWQATRGGGNGDYRCIVLAPASVQESADLTYCAFDLAEKYLHPVIILSDAAIGQMAEDVELPEMLDHDIDKFTWTVKGCKNGDKQRQIQNVFYTRPDYPDYLSSKYKLIEECEQRWESVSTGDAEVILVAYGISARICKEAVRNARLEGIKLGLIRPISLWPFPCKAFKNLSPNLRAFLSVEINILGQMVDDVKLACENRIPVDFFGTFFDVPETDNIVAKTRDILNNKNRSSSSGGN
jgi:2-oxoglutarate ferredoxin oxidoreductase subunit alpha